METPKVGCSTIKKNLQWMELGVEHEFPVHNKAASPLLSPRDSKAGYSYDLEHYLKFSFVRNPYTRALSCYLDKIKPQHKMKYRKELGLEDGIEISLEDFLNKVESQQISEMNPHWKPQSNILCMEDVSYDFIGRFEHFEHDLIDVITLICNRSGISPPEGGLYVVRHSPHQTQASSKLSEYMTEGSKELIQSIYRKDFEEFGYSIVTS